jgi:radical SAM-linked protein
MTEAVVAPRIRCRYTKVGKVRFLGHRDLARCLDRALRRTGVPVARTQGFTPRLRLAFGLALPTGAESVAEYLDIDLEVDTPVDLAELPPAVSAVLPPGVDITAVGPLEPHSGSLQSSVTSCSWEITLPSADDADVAARVERALAATELVATVTRKGVEAEHDLRPDLVHLGVLPPTDDGAVRLDLELANAAGAGGGRSVRPGDVVSALWPDLADRARHRRTAQWIASDGLRRDPLPAAAAVAPHAGWCAPC